MGKNSFKDWMLNEGVDIGIILLVGIILYIIWAIVCYFIRKGLIQSGIQSKQLQRQATMTTKRVGSVAMNKSKDLIRVATHDNNNDENEEKDESGKTSTVNNNNDNNETAKLSDDEKNIIAARAKTIVGVIRTIGNCAIYLIVIISIMDAVGAPTNSLLTVAALSGFAIALAVSNSITDFVSGLFILIEGSYNIGDIVTINSIFGTVERMTLRVSYVRGLDGTLYTIPNGEIRTIANHNRGVTISVTDVGITYESDIEKCMNLLNNEVSEAVSNDARLRGMLLEKPKTDGVGELAGSSVNIRFMVVSKPGLLALVKRVSNEHIHKFLRSDLAYPTMRVLNEPVDVSQS